MDNSNYSDLGRLLSELSWEGKEIKRYRDGGIGLENVLTAEVLQMLDFMPRQHFLGAIVSAFNTENTIIKEKILSEIEEGQFTLFPGDFFLNESQSNYKAKVPVQPDAIFETPSAYVIIEAKRIKKGASFQSRQLSKEFFLAVRNANGKLPLLLLILGEEPPVTISKGGRKEVQKDLIENLQSVYEMAEGSPFSLEEINSMANGHTAWITWNNIKTTIQDGINTFCCESISVQRSVVRLCCNLIEAIERHS